MSENTIDAAELVGLFTRQFQLCALKPGEALVLLTEGSTHRASVQAAFAAAEALGADAFEVGMPRPLDRQVVNHRAPASAPGVMAALKSADMVCTFTPPNLSPWLAECQQAGVRVLSINIHSSMLRKLQSPPGLKEAVQHAVRRYGESKRVRVCTEEGTDFTFTRGRPEDTELVGYYGFADQKGQFDQWGNGMVRDFPDEGSSHGTIVVKPGDVWILPFARVVESEVRLEIREGYVRKVQGGLDAKVFSAWLERNKRSEDDMDPYAVSHEGFGLHPNAHWDEIFVREHTMHHLAMGMRAFAGNFLFSTGPGIHRKTKGHIDLPLCDCTVYLDDEMIIKRGSLVDPAMIVKTGITA
jgi:2,5-dihydroxypyridine 5,6-dioxygenase